MTAKGTLFAALESGTAVSKQDYKKHVPGLRLELVELQRRVLDRAEFPVLVVIAGLNCAGRSETVNLLNEWMDPRFLATEAYGPPTPEELAHPPAWRYWRDLPPNGRIALFMNAWYTQPMVQRFEKTIRRRRFEAHLDRAAAFEKVLTDDGALVLKFWMHLGKASQKRRFKTLEKDPLQRWRVTKRDWKHWRLYNEFIDAAEHAIARTSRGGSPWKIVDGSDPGFA